MGLLVIAHGAAQEDDTIEAENEEAKRPFRILLFQGGANHSFKQRGEILRRGIEERVEREIEWTVIGDWTGRSDVAVPALQSADWKWDFDLILHDHCYSRVKSREEVARVLKPHLDGIPAVILHASLWSFPGELGVRNDWSEFTGAIMSGATVHTELEVSPTASVEMPFSWNEDSKWPKDEVYILEAAGADSSVILKGESSDTEIDVPVAWTRVHGEKEAKVFATSLGNRMSALSRPAFLDLVSKGLLWALGAGEEWASVSEERSLDGFRLSSLPLDPLRIVPSSAMNGRAAASSENTGEGHLASHAVDGDQETYWEADRAGPAFWELQMQSEQEIHAIALKGTGLGFPDLKLEMRSKEGHWESLASPDPFVDEEKDGVRFWRPEGVPVATGLRITFLSSLPGQHPGLREVAVYASEEEVPSRFVSGNPSFEGDGLLTADQPNRRVSGRLKEGWHWNSGLSSKLPVTSLPEDLFVTASGDFFVLPSVEEPGSIAIWLGRKDGETLDWVPFLEQITENENMAAFWDGEWLSTVVDGHITSYRDSNGDGKADEKKEGGEIELKSGERIRQLRLGMDGWVYARSSHESGERKGEVSRFRQTGGERQSLFVSSETLDSFWVESPGKVWVQSAGLAQGKPFLILPLHSPLLGAEFSKKAAGAQQATGHREFPFFFSIKDSIHSRGLSNGEAETSSFDLIAEIQGVDGVYSIGEQALVVQASDGEVQCSSLSIKGRNLLTVDLDKVSNEDLPGFLNSPSSQVKLETIFELYRRKRDLRRAVAKPPVNLSEGGRIARLGYLSQLPPSSSLGYLTSAGKSQDARVAFALLETHPSGRNLEVYRRILEIEDPEVTAQLLATLHRTRSHWGDLIPLVYDWTKNDASVLAGTATSYLFANAILDPIWQDLKEGKDPSHALSLLLFLEDDATIHRLIDLLDKSSDPAFQRIVLEGLSQIYRKGRASQAEGRTRIAELFREYLRRERFGPDFLLTQMQKAGIEPGSSSFLVGFARENQSFETYAIESLENGTEIPGDVVEWLGLLSKDGNRDPLLRMRSYRLLLRSSPEKEERIYEFIAPVLLEIASAGVAPELLNLWFETMVEEHGLSEFQDLAMATRSVENREIFWRSLWARIGNPAVASEEQDALVEILERLLVSDPGKSFELAKIILGADQVPPREVRDTSEHNEEEGGDGENDGVKDESEFVFALRQEISRRAGRNIERSELPSRNFEEFLSMVEAATPGIAKGWEVFREARCADCHNVHREGRVSGPDIVAATHGGTMAEFVRIFETEKKAEEDLYRAHQLELTSGQVVTGWIMDERDGDLLLLDVAGNSFQVPLDSIHLNRGAIGPRMGNKENKRWSAEELASLHAFLSSLSLQ